MEQAKSIFMRLLESALSRITVSHNYEEVLSHLRTWSSYSII